MHWRVIMIKENKSLFAWKCFVGKLWECFGGQKMSSWKNRIDRRTYMIFWLLELKINFSLWKIVSNNFLKLSQVFHESEKGLHWTNVHISAYISGTSYQQSSYKRLFISFPTFLFCFCLCLFRSRRIKHLSPIWSRSKFCKNGATL